jgi:hypothetical protein
MKAIFRNFYRWFCVNGVGAMCACYLPARRVVNPTTALRYEEGLKHA